MTIISSYRITPKQRALLIFRNKINLDKGKKQLLTDDELNELINKRKYFSQSDLAQAEAMDYLYNDYIFCQDKIAILTLGSQNNFKNISIILNNLDENLTKITALTDLRETIKQHYKNSGFYWRKGQQTGHQTRHKTGHKTGQNYYSNEKNQAILSEEKKNKINYRELNIELCIALLEQARNWIFEIQDYEKLFSKTSIILDLDLTYTTERSLSYLDKQALEIQTLLKGIKEIYSRDIDKIFKEISEAESKEQKKTIKIKATNFRTGGLPLIFDKRFKDSLLKANFSEKKIKEVFSSVKQ
jgi:hypothetical protein